MPEKGYRRLTMANRRAIEEGLRKHLSIGTIAKIVGKTWRTVANEIKGHRVKETPHFRSITDKNLCVHRDNCEVMELCRIDCTGMLCAKCSSLVCNGICEDFSPVGMCPKLDDAGTHAGLRRRGAGLHRDPLRSR